jgi:hypothetical protein
MYFPSLAALLLSLAAACLVVLGFGLRRNWAAAKSSGFKIVVLPTHIMSVPWLISGKLFLPLLQLLPGRHREQWIPFVSSWASFAVILR